MSDVVWESKLDDIYECKVVRNAPYQGILTIEQDNTVLFNKEVSLMYDAVFGPDVSDLAEWEDLCIKFVDGDLT